MHIPRLREWSVNQTQVLHSTKGHELTFATGYTATLLFGGALSSGATARIGSQSAARRPIRASAALTTRLALSN